MNSVAIIGGGRTKHQFDIDRNNGIVHTEIWTLPASVPEFNEIADRCFELHHYKAINKLGEKQKYVNDLKKLTCPLYLQKKHPSFPTSREYPIDYYLSKYRKFFDGTVAYLMVMAIDEGFDEIYLYGIDLNEGQYKRQQPTLEYWVGFAEGRGITVHIYDGSTIKQRDELYGYDWPIPVGEMQYSQIMASLEEKTA